MDSTSEEKLTSTFNVLLCVYFVLLFRTIIGAIPQLFDSIIPDLARTEKPTGWALFYLVYYIWVFYGFWAIILALKKSRSAIPALKLALPFSFFSFIIATLPKLTSIYRLMPDSITALCGSEYEAVRAKSFKSTSFTHQGVTVKRTGENPSMTFTFSVPGYKVIVSDVSWDELDLLFTGTADRI